MLFVHSTKLDFVSNKLDFISTQLDYSRENLRGARKTRVLVVRGKFSRPETGVSS